MTGESIGVDEGSLNDNADDEAETSPGQGDPVDDRVLVPKRKASPTKEIYQYGGKLMDDFGLSHLPIVPW